MKCMNDEGASHLIFSICFARRAAAAFWIENSRFVCVVSRFSFLRSDWKFAQWRPMSRGRKWLVWCTFRVVRDLGKLTLPSQQVCLFFLLFLFSRFSHSFAALFHLLARLAGGCSTRNGGMFREIYLLGYQQSVFVTALQSRCAMDFRERV